MCPVQIRESSRIGRGSQKKMFSDRLQPTIGRVHWPDELPPPPIRPEPGQALCLRSQAAYLRPTVRVLQPGFRPLFPQSRYSCYCNRSGLRTESSNIESVLHTYCPPFLVHVQTSATARTKCLWPGRSHPSPLRQVAPELVGDGVANNSGPPNCRGAAGSFGAWNLGSEIS